MFPRSSVVRGGNSEPHLTESTPLLPSIISAQWGSLWYARGIVAIEGVPCLSDPSGTVANSEDSHQQSSRYGKTSRVTYKELKNGCFSWIKKYSKSVTALSVK